ncbi:MAG: hypothetical protein MUP82_10395 [Candidatus Marinimicrobia bacterium]|nr:hypothetical protein [Candidatus Neomarinimicrobiota bacterium]
MARSTRALLNALLVTGYKITQSDWVDIVDTFASLDDDSILYLGAAAGVVDSDSEVGTIKAVFYFPFNVKEVFVFAGLGTQAVGSSYILDLNVDGATILSTKIEILASQNTSLTNPSQPVLTSSTFTRGQKITVDIDQIGASTPGKAPTVYFYGKLS